MEKVIIDVPSMYADHHVLAVRKLLTQLDGIGDVYASSAFKQVLVHYDPAVIAPEAVANTLQEAGYTEEMPMPVQEKLAEESWKKGTFRMTKTYPADLAMSGEFRKY
jgi:copper chaperone CopZ